MTRTPSTQVRWRVQVRKSRAHKWQNKGLFETREVARAEARLRSYCTLTEDGNMEAGGYGWFNTRVVRHISGKGRA